jgi:hypothetical protein
MRYSAAGRDPVRELVYGADGPRAVIATAVYRSLAEKHKKVLAFADGRQEAAFFAWYLEDSYRDILGRNLIVKAAQRLSVATSEGLSLGELSTDKVSPGPMVVLCEGRRGSGFYICGKCGAGFRTRQRTHNTPYGQGCHGTLELVSLGHEFVTDVLQVQFHRRPEPNVEPVWFAYSLAYALVEGAASGEVLEVPSNDLNATVAYSLGTVQSLR